MLSDDELLDFDSSNLTHYDEARAREVLAKTGDVFRSQLVAARWIDGWRERLADDPGRWGPSEDWQEGFGKALRDVVAHLRQGDLVPGGVLYDEEAGVNRPRPDPTLPG